MWSFLTFKSKFKSKSKLDIITVHLSNVYFKSKLDIITEDLSNIYSKP